MNINEYNRVAKQLNDQLNQSLIRFRVLDFSEYLTVRPTANFLVVNTFIVEWRIKIADKDLAGRQELSVEIITDSGINIAEYIVGAAANEVAHAIAHPDEIPEAKFVIT